MLRICPNSVIRAEDLCLYINRAKLMDELAEVVLRRCITQGEEMGDFRVKIVIFTNKGGTGVPEFDYEISNDDPPDDPPEEE